MAAAKRYPLYIRLACFLALFMLKAAYCESFIPPAPQMPKIPVLSAKQQAQNPDADLLRDTTTSPHDKKAARSWVIVANAHLNEKAGLSMVHALQQKGYPAYLLKANDHKVNLFIGPDLTQTALQALNQQENKQFVANHKIVLGKIIPFDPFSMTKQMISQ